MPGTYTATVDLGDRELSKDFQLRGDPNVAAVAGRVTRSASPQPCVARDLETQLNQMVGTINDLDAQIDGLLESIEGKDLANEEEVRTVAGDAQGQLTAVSAEVRRPPGSMSYRDWPRLIEQLRNISHAVSGPQARPTVGQMEVFTEIEAGAAQRAQELSDIVNGVIADLNELLEDAPKIITNWRRVGELIGGSVTRSDRRHPLRHRFRSPWFSRARLPGRGLDSWLRARRKTLSSRHRPSTRSFQLDGVIELGDDPVDSIAEVGIFAERRGGWLSDERPTPAPGQDVFRER